MKYLIKFTSEVIRTWCFLYGKVCSCELDCLNKQETSDLVLVHSGEFIFLGFLSFSFNVSNLLRQSFTLYFFFNWVCYACMLFLGFILFMVYWTSWICVVSLSINIWEFAVIVYSLFFRFSLEFFFTPGILYLSVHIVSQIIKVLLVFSIFPALSWIMLFPLLQCLIFI